MTFKFLQKLIKDNNIPEDVKLLSDSGWECFETEMNGVWYSEKDNTIVFTQGTDYDGDYILDETKCKCLYLPEDCTNIEHFREFKYKKDGD